MTPYAYLRRRPPAGQRHRARLRRLMLALVALLAFAFVNTSGSVRVTRLTRDIAASRARIRALESELSYRVRQQGAVEERAVVLERLRRRGGFATPDSGHVVWVRSSDRPGPRRKEPVGHGS